MVSGRCSNRVDVESVVGRKGKLEREGACDGDEMRRRQKQAEQRATTAGAQAKRRPSDLDMDLGPVLCLVFGKFESINMEYPDRPSAEKGRIETRRRLDEVGGDGNRSCIKKTSPGTWDGRWGMEDEMNEDGTR